MSLYSKLFDPKSLDDPNSVYFLIASLISSPPKKVLDVGCASGYLGFYLKKKFNCQVWGVEINPQDAQQAKKVLDKVITQNLESVQNWQPFFTKTKFDYIICADVIEHLVDPLAFITKLKNYLSPRGSIIFSLPNTAHYTIKLNLLSNSWPYQDSGLMDKTHLRFFTYKEITNLIESSGLFIENISFTTSEIPKTELLSLIDSNHLDPTSLILSNNLSSLESRIFQYVIKATKIRPKNYHSYGSLRKLKTILRSPTKYSIADDDIIAAGFQNPLILENNKLKNDLKNQTDMTSNLQLRLDHITSSLPYKLWKKINSLIKLTKK